MASGLASRIRQGTRDWLPTAVAEWRMVRSDASAHVFRQVGRADHADSVSRFTFTAGSSGLGGEQQYAEGRVRMGVHSRGRMVLCIHSRLERPRGVNSSEIQSLGSTRRRVRQTGAVVVGARTT
jgi:hypothetical protein